MSTTDRQVHGREPKLAEFPLQLVIHHASSWSLDTSTHRSSSPTTTSIIHISSIYPNNLSILQQPRLAQYRRRRGIRNHQPSPIRSINREYDRRCPRFWIRFRRWEWRCSIPDPRPLMGNSLQDYNSRKTIKYQKYFRFRFRYDFSGLRYTRTRLLLWIL